MRFFGLAVWVSLIAVSAHGEVLSGTTRSLFSSTPSFEDETISPRLLRTETTLRAESGAFSGSVVLSNRFAIAATDGADIPVFLEKKYVSFENDQWQIVAGDSHQELGRGIALALFRDEVLGIDYTVEGAAARFQPHGGDFRVFGGRARALQSPVALIPFQSPLFQRNIWLAGAEAKFKSQATQMGAHYLLTINQPQGLTPDKRWHTLGLSVNATGFAPGWDIYLETNGMSPEPLLSGTARGSIAWGSYGSLIYAPGEWKFKVEFKDYRNYSYDFRRPPTLEEDIVTSLNFSDVTAARFWAERKFGLYNQMRASLLWGEDRVVKASLRHAVASAKWRTGETSWEGRLGYRWLLQYSDLLHGDIKAKVPTLGGQFLELGYRKLHGFNNLSSFTVLDDRNFLDLAYTFSAHWGVNLGLEYVPSNPVAVGQYFANAGAVVKVDAFSSRLFVGNTSGGPQCSGGICRMVPAYSGFMLEGAYTF